MILKKANKKKVIKNKGFQSKKKNYINTTNKNHIPYDKNNKNNSFQIKTDLDEWKNIDLENIDVIDKIANKNQSKEHLQEEENKKKEYEDKQYKERMIRESKAKAKKKERRLKNLRLFRGVVVETLPNTFFRIMRFDGNVRNKEKFLTSSEILTFSQAVQPETVIATISILMRKTHINVDIGHIVEFECDLFYPERGRIIYRYDYQFADVFYDRINKIRKILEIR
uniref:translation initiation factor IF-1 n=1 Tax=Prototheca tumulicola TaxID=1737639 RepID=UPI003001913E